MNEAAVDLDFAPLEEAGHFTRYERPDLADPEILDYFSERTE